jgi:CheY-like chemotaxis protein
MDLSQSSNKNRILIADDEADIGEVLSAVAEDLGFAVTYVSEGGQVVAKTNALNPDVIMLDLRMPGTDGVEVIRELARINCTAKIILVSGMDQRTLNTVEALGREKDLCMVGTLVKPMHPDRIEELLKPLLKASPQEIEETDAGFVASSDRQLGPLVLYRLQAPMSEATARRQRAMIDCCWRMDNGDFINGHRLAAWSETQGVSKGMLNFYLHEALRQWQSLRESSANIELVLAIDSLLMQDISVTDFLVEVVEQYAVPHDVLVIETPLEGVRAAEHEAIDILARLRIKGFNIALVTEGRRHDEDLLLNLDKLPMDEIVVDMSKLNADNAIRNELELEFQFSSLTSVMHKKGLESSAINVNTQQVHNLVRKCGFDWARGQMMSEPMSANSLQRVLSSN